MKSSTKNLILTAALMGSVALALPGHAQESAAGQEMQQSGQAADNSASDAGSSIKHALNATADEASDAALTTKVKTALLSDKRAKKYTIQIESDQGVVTLTGAVASPSAATHVQTVASNVSGVKSVNNQLTWPTSQE
jgi:hyperosmotically inducible protein